LGASIGEPDWRPMPTSGVDTRVRIAQGIEIRRGKVGAVNGLSGDPLNDYRVGGRRQATTVVPEVRFALRSWGPVDGGSQGVGIPSPYPDKLSHRREVGVIVDVEASAAISPGRGRRGTRDHDRAKRRKSASVLKGLSGLVAIPGLTGGASSDAELAGRGEKAPTSRPIFP